MSFKYLILILIIISGCTENNKTVVESDSQPTPLNIDLKGKTSLVMVKNSGSSSAPKYKRSMSAESDTCLTIADVGTGAIESVVADPTRCFKKLEKVDGNGGYAIWVSDTSPDSSAQFAPGDPDSCGIINPDGAVWGILECPKSNGGFKNDKALHRVSANILRGLSHNGNYIEYNQANETETVVISDASGEIDSLYELDHANKLQYIYKIGNAVKQSIDGVQTVIPELANREIHPIDTTIQFKDGNIFKRAYFDDNGLPVQGPNTAMAAFNSSAVPVNQAYWFANGVDLDGNTPMPNGPVINSSLVGCDKSQIGSTTILLCDGNVYKYTDSSEDLELVNNCALGNCGSEFSQSCTTDEYYFIFTSFVNIITEEYTSLRLTRIDVVNETSIDVFDNTDIDYLITSMGCSSDSVTATTAAKTILITDANTTPVLSIIDLVAEEVISN